MNELVKWLTNLNSVVMPMRYLWVFFAFIMLNRAVKHFQSEYKFIKQKRLAMIAGAWCFLFTLIACVLGMVPKLDYAANPSAWWFQIASNILYTNCFNFTWYAFVLSLLVVNNAKQMVLI